MPYLFDLVPGQPALSAGPAGAGRRLVGAWARFVVRGDPGGPIRWPRWSGDGPILSISSAGPGLAAPAGHGVRRGAPLRALGSG